MRNTQAVKAPAKKTPKKPTTGATGKPKPISLMIEGPLADTLRAEAEGAGMMPLSLVRQRLTFGSLLTDETDEGKRFRLEIAEKAFRDAGLPIPSAKKDAAPSECIKVRVRPEDARLIASLTQGHRFAQPWIVASVLADIGHEAVSGEDTAERAAASLRTTPNHLLWRCIFRDANRFKEEVPVYIQDIEFHAETAEAMGRSAADWIGSLIMIGADILAKSPNPSFMTEGKHFELLTDAAELRRRREAEESAKYHA